MNCPACQVALRSATIELRSIEVQGKRRRCWVYPMKLVVSVLLIALGIAAATLI